jgi:hypothetical protein
MARPTDFKGHDEPSINYLNSLNTGTKATYKCYFKLFLNFKNMTSQQILDNKRNNKNNETETDVLNFKQWMKTQKTKKGNYYSDNAILTAIHAITGFFDNYRTPLKFTTNESHKLNGKAQRTSKDYTLTNLIIEKMASQGNLRDRYIVLLGKSLGLRASDFINLTYGTFRALDLNQEPPIFMGEIMTIKEKTIAYPFIDADALPIVRQIIESNIDKPDTDKILKFEKEELSAIIQRLAKNANIPLGDYHLRFHCFRKYLINCLARSVGCDSIWKQIVGKAISEDAYIDDSRLRESYIKVMEFTTIYKENGNGKVSKISEELTKQSKITDALLQDSIKRDSELEKTKQQLTKMQKTIDLQTFLIEMFSHAQYTSMVNLMSKPPEERTKELTLTPEAYQKIRIEDPKTPKKQSLRLLELNYEIMSKGTEEQRRQWYTDEVWKQMKDKIEQLNKKAKYIEENPNSEEAKEEARLQQAEIEIFKDYNR